MKSIIPFILNLPWTVVALIFGILSFPTKFSVHRKPLALVLKVKSFWWYSWLPGMKGVRALALGNVVLLGKILDERDIAHELVHIEQIVHEPFIYPFLYFIETLRMGYRNNKYEVEAYSKASNIYIEKV